MKIFITIAIKQMLNGNMYECKSEFIIILTKVYIMQKTTNENITRNILPKIV